MTGRSDSQRPDAPLMPAGTSGRLGRDTAGSRLPGLSAAPVREQVVERLKAAIAGQRFVAGQRLREREVCELTGASRTAVREALRQLESEGLVEVVPNRGPIIATVSLADAQEIYELRMALEGLAARLFARKATAEDIARLRATVDAFAQTGRVVDGALDPLALKRRFYETLMAGAGNRLASQSLDRLLSRVTSLRATSLGQPGRLRHTIVELYAIMDAIESRDEDAAEAACRAHVRSAARAAIEVMGGNPDDAFPALAERGGNDPEHAG